MKQNPIYDAVDVITAIQHVILDTLDGFSVEDIQALPAASIMKNILLLSVDAMSEIQGEAGEIRRHASDEGGQWSMPTNVPALNTKWISDASKDQWARLNTIPGMTPQIAIGLTHPDLKIRKFPIDITDVVPRLRALLPQLRAATKRTGLQTMFELQLAFHDLRV